MQIYIIILSACISSLLISCTTAPLLESKNEIPPNIENLKSVYESGFNKVMAGVPDEPSQTGDLNNQLLAQIRNLKNYSMKWAYIDDENVIRAFESAGPYTKAWFALYLSPRYTSDKTVPPYAVSPRVQPLAIRIQPFEVTREWAGLFIIHEISHVMDQVLGLESADPSDQEYLSREVVAYRYETVAADQLSNRNFSRSLQKVLNECKITTTLQAAHFFRDISPCASRAFQELSDIISPDQPKSEFERGLRKAFFTVALAFRIVDSKSSEEFKLASTLKQKELALRNRNDELNMTLELISGLM